MESESKSSFLDYVLLRFFKFIEFITNISIKVTIKASMKLTMILNPFVFIELTKRRWKTARVAIKTIKGTKKATMTLNVTEGHCSLPACWYMSWQFCF